MPPEVDPELLRQALEHPQAFCENLENLRGRNKYTDVINAITQVQNEFGKRHPGLLYCRVLNNLGLAWYRETTGDRSHNLELAIAALEAALEQPAVPAIMRAKLFDEKAFMWSDYSASDPLQKRQRSSQAFEAALDQYPIALIEGCSKERVIADTARTKTNYAIHLSRPNPSFPSDHRQNPEMRLERSRELQRALSMCQEALASRTFESNAINWAYSTLALSRTHRAVIEVAATDVDKLEQQRMATRIAQSVLDQLPQLGQEHRMLRSDAQVLLGELANDPLTTLELSRSALDSAEMSGDFTVIGQGAIALVLALLKLDRKEEALRIHAAHEVQLQHCQLSRRLTYYSEVAHYFFLQSVKGNIEWAEAGSWYEMAVHLSNLHRLTHVGQESRMVLLQEETRIYRQASVAFALAGRLEKAVETLESGQARELRSKIGFIGQEEDLEERIREVPQALREELRSSIGGMASPLPAEREQSEETHARVCEKIRRLPGMETWSYEATFQEIRRAAAPGWPVIYVDPSPAGTLLLFLFANAEPRMALLKDCRAEDISAASVLNYLSRGIEQRETLTSRLIRPLLQQCLKFAPNAIGLTLILCGPLNRVAVHTIPWTDGNFPTHPTRCLLDTYAIRFVPSAFLARIAQVRAKRLQSTKLQDANWRYSLRAFIDPGNNLRTSFHEAESIKRMDAWHSCQVYMGSAATWERLLDEAGATNLLHFSCHAKANIHDPELSVVQFADGWYTLRQISESVDLRNARLVWYGACTSFRGRFGGDDEMVSLTTATIGRGAAGTIGMSWDISDFAAALLSIHFYDTLRQNFEQEQSGDGSEADLTARLESHTLSETPLQGSASSFDFPVALQRAQLWLRDLSWEGDPAFFRRNLPAKRLFNTWKEALGQTLPAPFAEYKHWAAAAYVGA